MSEQFRIICMLAPPAFGPVETCLPESQTVRNLLLRQQWIALQAPGRTGRAPLTAFAVSTSRAEAPSAAEELSPEDDWEDSAPASEAAASELTGAELFSRQHVGRWTPAMAAYFPFGGLRTGGWVGRSDALLSHTVCAPVLRLHVPKQSPAGLVLCSNGPCRAVFRQSVV